MIRSTDAVAFSNVSTRVDEDDDDE